MTRLYDTVHGSVGDIPADAPIVAGYIDGQYTWTDADWAMFPNAIYVRIVTDPTNNNGDVYDCEPGNGTPEDAPKWLQLRHDAGHPYPVIYCDRDHYGPSVTQAIINAGINFPHGRWIGDWTGTSHTVANPDPINNGRVNADAVQWGSPTFGLPPELHGKNVDISETYGAWPNGATLTGGEWTQGQLSAVDRILSVTTPMMTGGDVEWVQEHVGATPDGVYGPQTALLVEDWQAGHHLTVDGVVGPQTWESLGNNPPVNYAPHGSTVPAFPGEFAYGSGLPPHQPVPGVKVWQQALTEHGFMLNLDGMYGAATTAAVKDCQHAHDIPTDGVAGPQTWGALWS